MFTVLFDNGKVCRKIGEVKTKRETFVVIDDFLKKCNYKSYYKNIIKIDEHTERIDVGSWSEFFYVKN